MKMIRMKNTFNSSLFLRLIIRRNVFIASAVLIGILTDFHTWAQLPGQVIQEKSSDKSPATPGQASMLFEIVIGSTIYDIQNYSDGRKIYNSGNNKGVIFNYGNGVNLTPLHTYGNFYDGSTWISGQGFDIDTIGFSTIDEANGTEYVVGHYRPFSVNSLVLCKRSPIGAGAWVKSVLPSHPAGHTCLWAKMKVGGLNNQTLHVIAMTQPVAMGGTLLNGVDGVITYSRSQNGGISWDLVHVSLPNTTSNNYSGMLPGTYAIDATDSIVAITQGSYYNDWVMWKSTDNGNSWVRKVIQHFPIPAYDPATMDTDVNNDSFGDDLASIDGYQSVLIDNNGMVHCWAGAMSVRQDPTMSLELVYNDHALLYWNESYTIFPPVTIATPEDIDGSGSVDLAPSFGPYGISLAGMPSSGIDASGNIYLAISMIVENITNAHPDPLEEESFRNIYMLKSTDSGASWTIPIRMEPSDFDESVFPGLPRNVGGDLIVVVQKDGEPGSWVMGNDPITPNEIIIFYDDTSTFFAGAPLVNYHPYRIEGIVYYDSNQNGQRDTLEYGMSGVPVIRNPGSQIVTTNSIGKFAINANPGNHTVSVLPGSNWNITNNPQSYNVLLSNAVFPNVDFGLYPSSQATNLSVDVTGGIARCNNYINYWITYRNTGTTILSGTVNFEWSPMLAYETALPAPSSINGDTAFFNFSNLLPFQQRTIQVTTSSFGVMMGSLVSNCANVYFTNGGINGTVGTCVSDTIVCSWDPNDKLVIPPGVGSNNYVLFSDTLIYTIRFQNTGNDTAFNVSVLDTLHASLNPATFRFISSSHPVTVETFPGNIKLYRFDNILLPDSNVNEPGSNGFLKYSISPFSNAPIGTPITNTAHIYFDYNPAIVTNTTLNTVVDVIGIAESDDQKFLTAFPNPTSDKVTIVLHNENANQDHIILTNLLGEEIALYYFNGQNRITINLSDFSNGLYFISLKETTGKSLTQKKLILMR